MRLSRVRLLFLLDCLTLAGAMVGSSLVAFGTWIPWHFEPQIRTLVVIMAFGLVGSEWLTMRLVVGEAPIPGYGRALVLTLMVLTFTSVLLIATRVYFSRSFIVWALVFFLVGAVVHRAWLRRRPWSQPMVLVTRDNGLVEELRQAPHADVLSVIDPMEHLRLDPPPPGAMLGIDLRSVLSDQMAQYISSCTLAGLDVRPMFQIYEAYTGRLPVVALAEGWEMSIPVVRTTPYLAGKRLFDLLVVLITAPFTLIVAAGLAAIIRLSSPGPVIFRQLRVGRGGRCFQQYKFRSMWHNPDNRDVSFTSPGDERVVPAARVLRRFRLDELPQLWNVLKGDLSLVGPRPEQAKFVERFNQTIPFYSQRHLIRPGITGWAQVNHGYASGEEGTIRKLTYDLFYVKHMSPWLDLEILGRSCWTVLSGFGAR